MLAPPSPHALVEAAWAALNTTQEAYVGQPTPRAEPVVPPASAYAPPPPPPTRYASVAPAAPPPAPRPGFAMRAAPVMPVSMGPLVSERTVREAQHLAGNDPRLAGNIRALASYDDAMRSALLMPDFTGAQRGARNAAITGARARLAGASHRRLTPAAVTRIDVLLGLPQTDPALGVD